MITFPSMLAALASSSRTASKPAVIELACDETVTFAELYERGRRRVNELADHGVGEGSIVAVIAYNEGWLFEHLVAAGLLGAALMPLSPALPDRDVQLLLEKAEAAVCLCSPKLATSRLDELGQAGVRAVRVGSADRWPAADADSSAASTETRASAGFPAPDDTCWVSTTGGSSGAPKLFAVSHERLLTNLVLNAVEWGWTPYRAQVTLAPLAHGMGFSHAVGQLATGGTVALVERYSAKAALEAAARVGPCWTAVVPTVLHDLVEVSGADNLAGLELVVSAGAPLPASLRERVLAKGPRLIEYYGSTELGWVTWIDHVPGDVRNSVVGRPTIGAEVRIADSAGAPVSDGVTGLIEKRGRPYAVPVAGGPSAYRANAAAWETSGDVGYIDADGALVLSGRRDDMLVVGGQNVYPVEVEAVLREHPLVREALVRGEPSDRLGQQVVAFVEPVPGASIDSEELAEFCRRRLAKFKRPSSITVLPALPRNTAGKILRSAPAP